MSGEEKTMTFGGDQGGEVATGRPDKVTVDMEGLGEAIAGGFGMEPRSDPMPENPKIAQFLRRMSDEDVANDINAEMPESEEAAPAEPEGVEPEEASGIVDEETGKEFPDELSYMKWKAGNDGRKWGEEKAKLMEQLAELRGRVDAISSGQSPEPKTLSEQRARVKAELFQNAPKEELESGFVSMDTLVDAFIQNGALLGQNIQQYLKPTLEQIAALESQTKEFAARSKYQIDANKEKAVLQKHPYLKNLSEEERMAVLADLAPKAESNGVKPRAQIAQRIPKPNAQEYVEGSVRTEPTRASMEEIESEFESLDTKEQLNLLSGIIKANPEAQSLFKQPETF